MRKMQGNLGQSSIVDCQQMFTCFFSNTVDKIVQEKYGSDYNLESETKRKIVESICEVFQVHAH